MVGDDVGRIDPIGCTDEIYKRVLDFVYDWRSDGGGVFKLWIGYFFA